MSIIKLNPSNFQNYKVVTNPRRLFTSSSEDGVTGDVQLFADASPRLKDIDPSFAEDGYDSLGIEKLRAEMITSIDGSSTQVQGIEQYLAAVNAHPQGERQQKRQEVLRYEPGVKLDKNFLSKRTIKESLFPFYKTDYNTLDWAYTNYHSLNFFRLRGNEPGLGGTTVTPATLDIDFIINPFFITIYPLKITNNSPDYSVVWNVTFNQISLNSNAFLLPGILTINTSIPGSGPPWTLNGLISSFNSAVTTAVGSAGEVILTTTYANPNESLYAASKFGSETYNVDAATEVTSPSIQPINNNSALIYRSTKNSLQTVEIVEPSSLNVLWIDDLSEETQFVLHNRKPEIAQVSFQFTENLLLIDGVYVTTISLNPTVLQIKLNISNPGSFPINITNLINAINNETHVHGIEIYTSNELQEIDIISMLLQSPINYNLDAATVIYDTDLQNIYAPAEQFTFDFWIKPKTPQKFPNDSVAPGTILHMSSCYAISVTTSSIVGLDGYVDYHHLLLQLSQSAEISPMNIFINNNSNIVFDSNILGTMTQEEFAETKGNNVWASKASLKDNYWNHVCIRWPGAANNGGTGSIWINGEFDTYISSSNLSLMQPYFLEGNDPDALFVGNFYEGTNDGPSTIQRFFNENVSEVEGLTPYIGHDEDPTEFQMRHSLWAEAHDIKIYDRYKLDHEVLSMMKDGRSGVEEGLLFYLPPFFTKETRSRQILQTPFFSTAGSTNDPFNVSLSFGVGGFESNLENFVKDFVTNEYPRLYNLTSSKQEEAIVVPLTANDIMYDENYGKGSTRRRLYAVLPNDNGRFLPNFQLLNTGTDGESKFVDSFGVRRMDLISLEDMVSTDGLLMGPQTVANLSSAGGTTLFQELEGASPEDPSVAPGSILTVLRRTGDPSSNELTIFDVSNMFYGDRILPKSLIIRDSNPRYLDGEFRLTVQDDGKGSLYRADAESKHAEWSNVGNVLYEEGLIVIKSPALRFFGQLGYTIEFRGERNVYVLEIAVPLEKNELNVSNNPSYVESRPTSNANETAERFVYATSVNLHDDNLNVIARANLSQAVVKRDNDRMVVKLRMDF